MCEEYNGWPNRETWALALHFDNDYGLYTERLERVATAIEVDENLTDYADDNYAREHKATLQAYAVGQAMKAWWEELTDPSEQLMSAESILEMVRDIGSEYRIDWDRIGESWLAEVES